MSLNVPQSQEAGAEAQAAAWVEILNFVCCISDLVVWLLGEIVSVSNEIAELAWVVSKHVVDLA